MKLSGLLAVIVVLLGVSPGSAAHLSRAQRATSGSEITFWSIQPSSMRKITLRRVVVPLQTDSTPTATPSPGPSTTPTVPDTVTLLSNMFDAWKQVQTAHFEIVTDMQQPTVERLVSDGIGDAACAGPAMRGTVTLKDTIERTRKTTTTPVQFARVKKKAWIKWKETKGKWVRVKTSNLDDLGVYLGVILQCPAASTAATYASARRAAQQDNPIRDMVNLGTETFQGIPVWHVRLTLQTTDQGTPELQTWDVLLAQDTFLPQQLVIRGNLAAQQINFVVTLTMSKFGEKLNIKAPKGAR